MKKFLLLLLVCGAIKSTHTIYYKRYPYSYNYCTHNETDHQRTFPYFLAEIDTGERCGYSYFSHRLAAIR